MENQKNEPSRQYKDARYKFNESGGIYSTPFVAAALAQIALDNHFACLNNQDILGCYQVLKTDKPLARDGEQFVVMARLWYR